MNEKIFGESAIENTLPGSLQSTRHSARSRSSRSGSSTHKVSRRLLLAVALSISLLTLFFVVIFAVVRISSLANENKMLQSELTKARQELSQTGPELEQTRKILSEMTKGRLPHLLDLVPDKVLKIDDLYFKNIVFTVLNKNGTRSYEYRLVMENNTSRTIQPSARIFVFDRYGVQIGSAEVTGRLDIAPGESRSQSSVIDRFIDEEPHYFYISKLPADKETVPIQTEKNRINAIKLD